MNIQSKQTSMSNIIGKLNDLYRQLLVADGGASSSQMFVQSMGLAGYIFDKFGANISVVKGNLHMTAASAKVAIDVLSGADTDSTLYPGGIYYAVLQGNEAAWNDWVDLAGSTLDAMQGSLNLSAKTSISSFFVSVGNNMTEEVAQAADHLPNNTTLVSAAVALVAIFLILIVK